MPYFISKPLNLTMDEAYIKVSSALQAQGFGIVTNFDVSNASKIQK